MLEGSGVEHDMRSAFGEDLLHVVSLAEVGQHQPGRVEQGRVLDDELRAVEAGLVAVDHDEL